VSSHPGKNGVQRYFDRLDFDDDARFLVLLFNGVDVAIEALLAGVALRECVGMGLGAFTLDLDHSASHLDPPVAILRIDKEQG
jgi:hypothetical protein